MRLVIVTATMVGRRGRRVLYRALDDGGDS